jgi:Zn-dependent protease
MVKEKKHYTSFHDISPREYMYFPKGTIEMGKPGQFSKTEIIHLLISIGILTIAFSLALTKNNIFQVLVLDGFDLNKLQSDFGKIFLGIITAFFVHELSHKFIAQKYRLWSEFRMYPWGLGLALFLGIFTPFVFAAPGAVLFRGKVRNFEIGQIALAGPLSNIIIAAITLPLYLFVFYETPIASQIIGFICLINSFLATFNLLPFGPLDGIKIIRWNVNVWAISFITAITLMMTIFVRFPISS